MDEHLQVRHLWETLENTIRQVCEVIPVQIAATVENVVEGGEETQEWNLLASWS